MNLLLVIVILTLISQSLTNFMITEVKAFDSGINHVVVLVMENKGYTPDNGSSDAPFQNELAKKYASASKFSRIVT